MNKQSGIKDVFSRQTGFSEDELKDIGMKLILESRKAANNSDHHRYHVGSALLAVDKKQAYTITSNANRIPDALKDQGMDSHDQIGHGSPTVHGEFPLLYQAPPSEHIFLGCNTPNCASCLKSAIMRDVDALFVDAKSLPGFKSPDAEENPWTQDRADFWNDLCIPIARAAQIPIYAINPEEDKISILLSGKPPHLRPKPESEASILTDNQILALQNNPDLFLSQLRGKRAAIGVATDKSTGENMFIFAEDSMPPGFESGRDQYLVDRFADQHYHFPLDPIIHMMMTASKHNLELQNGKILTNFVPSSGRQLDLASIGLKDMLFTKDTLPPTEEAAKAISDLSHMGVISYHKIKPKQAILQMINQSFGSMEKQSTIEH